MSEGGRSRRLARRIGVVVCVSLAVATVAGLPVYVWPQVDPLRRADVILVLGGPDYSRYPYGLELAERGLAPNLVISNPAGADDTWLTSTCAAAHPGFAIQCFVPDPPTTKGEGREFRRLALANGWRTAIVVTIRPHVSRARFILEGCYDGELTMAPAPGRISAVTWAYQYVYQTAGYVRALFQPGC